MLLESSLPVPLRTPPTSQKLGTQGFFLWNGPGIMLIPPQETGKTQPPPAQAPAAATKPLSHAGSHATVYSAPIWQNGPHPGKTWPPGNTICLGTKYGDLPGHPQPFLACWWAFSCLGPLARGRVGATQSECCLKHSSRLCLNFEWALWHLSWLNSKHTLRSLFCLAHHLPSLDEFDLLHRFRPTNINHRLSLTKFHLAFSWWDTRLQNASLYSVAATSPVRSSSSHDLTQMIVEVLSSVWVGGHDYPHKCWMTSQPVGECVFYLIFPSLSHSFLRSTNFTLPLLPVLERRKCWHKTHLGFTPWFSKKSGSPGDPPHSLK